MRLYLNNQYGDIGICWDSVGMMMTMMMVMMMTMMMMMVMMMVMMIFKFLNRSSYSSDETINH